MASDSGPPRPAEEKPAAHSAASDLKPGKAIPATPPKRPSRRRQVLSVVVGLLLTYFVMAYLVMPAVWKRYVRRHPSLENVPRVTHTKSGIPGDPLNVALIGTEAELIRIMKAARWHMADPLSVRDDLKIAAAAVLKRPYDDAPVSNLYLFDRKEDLAFEQPVGDDPRKRHHVRFWKSPLVDEDGRPVWVGSAIFDDRVGLSRTTGQITHHTAADIDTERDYLFTDLKRTNQLAEFFIVEDFHQVRDGRNGGGDPWQTDGNLYAGVIRSAEPSQGKAP
jgi:hypothetical protein